MQIGQVLDEVMADDNCQASRGGEPAKEQARDNTEDQGNGGATSAGESGVEGKSDIDAESTRTSSTVPVSSSSSSLSQNVDEKDESSSDEDGDVVKGLMNDAMRDLNIRDGDHAREIIKPLSEPTIKVW